MAFEVRWNFVPLDAAGAVDLTDHVRVDGARQDRLHGSLLGEELCDAAVAGDAEEQVDVVFEGNAHGCGAKNVCWVRFLAFRLHHVAHLLVGLVVVKNVFGFHYGFG